MEDKVIRDFQLLKEKVIEEKMRGYVEPEREGTAKGDPIGFSREKFLANLYVAANVPLKEVADRLKVPYGTLRNWNTEPRFKDLVEGHRKEYAREWLALLQQKDSAWYAKLPRASSIAMPDAEWHIVLDNFMPILFKAIEQEIDKRQDPELHKLLISMIPFLHPSGKKDLSAGNKADLKTFRKLVLKYLERLLTESMITDDERTLGLMLLACLAE